MFQHIVTFLKAYHLKTDFLKQEMDRFIEQFKPREQWLLTEFIYGIIRNQILIDSVIDQRTKKIKQRERILLQIGIYGILFQDTTKDGILVNDLIRYVKKYIRGKEGFFNAVLRGVTADRNMILIEAEKNPELFYSIPEDFATYLKLIPSKWIQKIYRRSVIPPHYYFRVTRKGLAFSSALEQYRFFDQIYQLPRGGIGPIKEALEQGWCQIQDISAQLSCHLLDIQESDRVLELCAAPGTKTSLLAEQAATVMAIELNPHKVERLQIALKPYPNVSVVTQDARTPIRDQFDKVLIDPPCSALGTLGKYPEKKYLFDLRNIDCYPAIQLGILENGFASLKSGGELIYVVCTFTPDETEGVIDTFLSTHKNAIEVDFTTPESDFSGSRFYSIDHYDGDFFFICKIKKQL